MRRVHLPGVRLLLALALVAEEGFAFQDTITSERWSQSEIEALVKRIEGEVEELRGAKFVRPVTVRIATPADLRKFVRRAFDLVDPPERMAADETIAKLLGLIPPDMSLLTTTLAMLDEVGGYYDPFDPSFSIMESTSKDLAGPILAHELCHALDDQLYGMAGALVALSENTDTGQAYIAVVEGSGMSLSNQWMIQHGGELDGTEDLTPMNSQTASVPMMVWKPFQASYLAGPAFLGRTNSLLTGQTRPAAAADIEHAFRTPPRSTEQVLHPEKYWDPEKSDEPREVVIPTRNLPKGWSVAREDTLGELILAILCTPPEERGNLGSTNPKAALDLRFTNELAQGWGGDRVVLLTKGEGRYLALVTRWDSERDAAEFYGGLHLLLPSFESAARTLAGSSGAGSGVEIAYGSAADEVTLVIYSAVERRDLRRLETALTLKVR